jgi:zeaxanthin glucosyltransferase
MAHFGALSNPAPSHLMALVSLGRELQKRGHRFTLFAVPDLAATAEKHGISFHALDNASNYLPGLDTFLKDVGQGNFLSYREMLTYGRGEIALYCEQGPKAMKDGGVQCLISDQVVIPASTVAERLNIPFVTMCPAVPLCTDADAPPCSKPWPYSSSWGSRFRNGLTYSVLNLFSMPFSRKLNAYRRQWGLAPYSKLDETFSDLAQITQLVPEFDFPFERPRANQFYVGPFQREDHQSVDFPYERLDGRPVIFAVLGTLLGATPGIWQTIAESCVGLDAQLVISLGGRGRTEDYQDLPGHPLVVLFAPQRELLKRVTLMITHGGLNSAMETLTAGVPLISLHAAAGDQPGVAMRIQASGAGEILPLKGCRTEQLRPLVRRVFSDAKYKAQACRLQKAIQQTRGMQEAADIVERVSGSSSRPLPDGHGSETAR